MLVAVSMQFSTIHHLYNTHFSLSVIAETSELESHSAESIDFIIVCLVVIPIEEECIVLCGV